MMTTQEDDAVNLNRAIRVLQQVEWRAWDEDWYCWACPQCDGRRPNPESQWEKAGRPSGHEPDCELAAVLKGASEPRDGQSLLEKP